MPTEPDDDDPDRRPGESLSDLPAPAVRRSNRFAPSLVWVVPVVAAIAALSLTLRTYLTIGPSITVSLQTAEGLEAGKTEVRYKEVVIGHVTGIVLSDDHAHVLVHVRLDQRDKDFAVADTRFWVVRPRLGLAGVSGLGTLDLRRLRRGGSGHVDGRARPISPDWRLRPRCCTARRAAASWCTATTWARSISVRRCITGASRPDASAATSSTPTARASRSSCSSMRRTITSSRRQRISGTPAASICRSAPVGLKLNTESLATVLAGGVAFQSFDDSKAVAARRGRNALRQCIAT